MPDQGLGKGLWLFRIIWKTWSYTGHMEKQKNGCKQGSREIWFYREKLKQAELLSSLRCNMDIGKDASYQDNYVVNYQGSSLANSRLRKSAFREECLQFRRSFFRF